MFLGGTKVGTLAMIYFIKCCCPNGFIKIGFTRGIHGRLAGLSTTSPYQMQLLRIVRGTIAEERALHRRFHHLHERGEWFRPGPDLVTYIDSIQDETPPPDTADDRERVERRLAKHIARARAPHPDQMR